MKKIFYDEAQLKSGEILCRQDCGQMVRAPEDGARTIEFAITTEDVDSYGDVVVASGGRFERYLKNPVVLAFHNSRSLLPVGKSLELKLEEKRILSTCEFGSEETMGEWGKVADSFYRAYKHGFMSAVSIGFQPLDWTYDKVLGSFLITDWDLYEYSCVPIPANPNALATERQLADDLRKAYEQVLDTTTPSPQRDVVEAARKSISGAPPKVRVRLNPTYKVKA